MVTVVGLYLTILLVIFACEHTDICLIGSCETNDMQRLECHNTLAYQVIWHDQECQMLWINQCIYLWEFSPCPFVLLSD